MTTFSSPCSPVHAVKHLGRAPCIPHRRWGRSSSISLLPAPPPSRSRFITCSSVPRTLGPIISRHRDRNRNRAHGRRENSVRFSSSRTGTSTLASRAARPVDGIVSVLRTRSIRLAANLVVRSISSGTDHRAHDPRRVFTGNMVLNLTVPVRKNIDPRHEFSNGNGRVVPGGR